MALGELGPILPEDERYVRETRHGPSHGAIDEDLAMCIRQMLLGANDVADLHIVVVDDHAEVVRRQTVGAHDNEVAEGLLSPGHLSADLIVDRDVTILWNVKT